MGINIAKAQEETRTVTVEYGGESADVVFYPRRLTPSLLRSVKGGEDVDSVITVLARFVASWDVLGADGQPLPPTAEVMSEFPLDFLSAVLEATMQKTVPGEARGATS